MKHIKNYYVALAMTGAVLSGGRLPPAQMTMT